MKTYISPIIRLVNTKAESPILAGSNGRLTGGGSNNGQKNPTAESKEIWFDDDDDL